MNDSESFQRALRTLRHTMGQDILACLENNDVFEFMINPDGKLWVDTFSKGRKDTDVLIKPQLTQQIIYQVADITGQVCTDQHPMLSAELPDGSRFQGFLPKVVAAPALVIRKHIAKDLTLEDYVHEGIMTQAQMDAIVQAIIEKKNIIAAGGTKSGKTTLLKAILRKIAELCPLDRIVLIEDLPELAKGFSTKNMLALCTTDTVGMDGLLRESLRATPDRIVVGEVRSGEALSLLDAWSTGHGGGGSSLHTNSARQTLQRLQNMISRVSLTPQQSTIGEAVDLIVYLKRKGTSRFIEEIIAVDGYDEFKKEYIIKNIA
ncbi:P-type conjugative transfer ATPase TrbB [Anaerospora hongkongensis]|uniref:P-type conjugative transfer ATPase TrbB n=1 Tax=Anaerospora hongkongensis TaxID=244830 RepID=UPI002FDAFA93